MGRSRRRSRRSWDQTFLESGSGLRRRGSVATNAIAGSDGPGTTNTFPCFAAASMTPLSNGPGGEVHGLVEDHLVAGLEAKSTRVEVEGVVLHPKAMDLVQVARLACEGLIDLGGVRAGLEQAVFFACFAVAHIARSFGSSDPSFSMITLWHVAIKVGSQAGLGALDAHGDGKLFAGHLLQHFALTKSYGGLRLRWWRAAS